MVIKLKYFTTMKFPIIIIVVDFMTKTFNKEVNWLSYHFISASSYFMDNNGKRRSYSSSKRRFFYFVPEHIYSRTHKRAQ